MRDQVAKHHGIEAATATVNRDEWKTILPAADDVEGAHAALRAPADLPQRVGAADAGLQTCRM
jgi:hypothetical protein